MSVGELDLADLDLDDLEGGSFLNVAGWFKCRIEDVRYDNEKDQTVLKLVVSEGPYHGYVTNFRLVNPEAADDPKKAKQRMVAAAKRIGLVTDAQLKELQTGGKGFNPDFNAVIGREIWCEVTKSKGNQGNDFYGPSYMGLFGLNDERVPADAKGGKVSKTSRGPASANGSENAPTGGSPKKDPLADL